VSVGTLERHRIELRAERQEPILCLAVTEGDKVEAGDVVVELDRRRVAAQLDLTERERTHFAYLAEVDLIEDAARELPTGLPVEVSF